MKRWLDVLVAGLILSISIPILVILYVLVRLDSPGPFFFKQKRLGKNGVIFEALKIRTMTHKFRIPSEEIFSGNSEVTSIGKVLRRLKIDEVPQILNVLKGDMSLVGPRPCLPNQLTELNDDGQIRLKVRPGLTGLAQIKGNIYLSWPERWKYDRLYVENLSLQMDVEILLKTMLIVLFGEQKFIKKPDETHNFK